MCSVLVQSNLFLSMGQTFSSTAHLCFFFFFLFSFFLFSTRVKIYMRLFLQSFFVLVFVLNRECLESLLRYVFSFYFVLYLGVCDGSFEKLCMVMIPIWLCTIIPIWVTRR